MSRILQKFGAFLTQGERIGHGRLLTFRLGKFLQQVGGRLIYRNTTEELIGGG